MVRPVMLTGEVTSLMSVQVLPALVEYWYFVIAELPIAPAAKAIDAEALPGVATSDVGAAGAEAKVIGVLTYTTRAAFSAVV